MNQEHSEQPFHTVKRKIKIRHSLYLLPNMMTAFSLLCGFLAIIWTIEARTGLQTGNAGQYYVWAAYAILASVVFDGLDGTVARITRTQSSFGGQLDSLCDCVAFGITPAIMIYEFSLHQLGRLGIAACFIFALCGALRLARFNVQSVIGQSKGHSTGIPIPIGAAPLAVFILAHDSMSSWLQKSNLASWQEYLANLFVNNLDFEKWFLFVLVILLSLGMVSSIKYISNKSLKLPKEKPFKTFVFIMITIALLMSEFATVTLTLFLLIYCIHGPILWIWNFKKYKEEKEADLFYVDVECSLEESLEEEENKTQG